MDFAPSARSDALKAELIEFDADVVTPADADLRGQREESGDPHFHPPVMEELKTEARKRGLWNLFMPDGEYGARLTNLEYAPLCELMGGSPLLAEATNCSAPDTGNMEVLAQFGTPLQQEQFLQPLLDGEIRSCFAMTEPWVARSDATNIQTRIERDGDDYVVNAHKWFTSGALDRAARSRSSWASPTPTPTRTTASRWCSCRSTPRASIVRSLPVFGHDDGGGHCETLFENVRIPKENLLGEEGGGFAIAQARLGPGRIHHCMRAIGMAEKALELMCKRAQMRVAFGKPLADQGVIQERIAESRIEIEQARLLTMKAAWLMDTVGKKSARFEIAAIKVRRGPPRHTVIDRAIQIFGGAGVSDDWPLAEMYAHARTLHLVDGPDEVHLSRSPAASCAVRDLRGPSGFQQSRRGMKVRIGFGLRQRCGRSTATRFGELVDALEAQRLRLDLVLGARPPVPRPIRWSALSFAAGAHEEDQARHERAGAARPQPGAAGQAVGDARRAVGRPRAPRVRARRRRTRSSNRRSASPARTAPPFFDEALPLLRRLWTEDVRRPRRPPLPLRGHDRAAQAAQQPLDVWLGGRAPAELRRVGRLGDGWLPSFCTPEQCAAARPRDRGRGRRRAGRAIDPEHFGAMVFYTHDEMPEQLAQGARDPQPRRRSRRPRRAWLARRARAVRALRRGRLLEARARPVRGTRTTGTTELAQAAAEVLPLQT